MLGASAAIAALNASVNTFESSIDPKVNSIRNVTERIRETTQKIYDSVNQFKTDIISQEEKQLAQENLMRLEQIIKEEFGDYEDVRKTVMGIVRDFDINLVRNTTIKEMSEELWMTNSKYWLSFALISLSAWINNAKQVADNAIVECIRKDKIKATLFYCLLNLRFDRLSTAKKWFNAYLSTIDPGQSQLESEVLLLAYLNGVFGKDVELNEEVNGIIKSWVIDLENDITTNQTLFNNYYNYIFQYTVMKNVNYEYLSHNMKEYDALVLNYINVSKYDYLIEEINDLNNDEEKIDKDYKSKVDSILYHLISDYDKEEQEIKNQQSFFKLILKNEGNITNAKTQFLEQENLRKESYNIGKQMARWFLYDRESVSKSVQKFGLKNTKKWYISAIEKWNEKLENEKVNNFTLNIDNMEYVINDNYDDIKNEMSTFYDSNKNNIIYFNGMNIFLFMVMVASIFASIYVSLYALMVVAVALIIIIARIIKEKKEYPKRVQNAKNILNKSIIEIQNYIEYYQENAKKRGKLIALINEV